LAVVAWVLVLGGAKICHEAAWGCSGDGAAAAARGGGLGADPVPLFLDLVLGLWWWSVEWRDVQAGWGCSGAEELWWWSTELKCMMCGFSSCEGGLVVMAAGPAGSWSGQPSAGARSFE
jgi:hypothetical protein